MVSGLAQIRIAVGAEADLHGIWRRRRAQRGAEGDDGADALLDRLVAAIETLAEHPRRGAVPPELDALGIHDYRQLSLPPFRLIYLVEEESLGGKNRQDATLVTILIVADARRDFRTLLQERLLSGR